MAVMAVCQRGLSTTSTAELSTPSHSSDPIVKYLPLVLGLNRQKIDGKRFYRLVNDLAKRGLSSALAWLALCYLEGIGVPVNMSKSKDLLQRLDHWIGQSLIAEFASMEHRSFNQEKRVKLVKNLREADMRGEIYAAHALGRCLHDLKFEGDTDEGLRYYMKAAEQGNAWSQNNLGLCYQHGKGIEKDMKRAVDLYRAAAEQGFCIAQSNLAWCYENGKGVIEDLKRGIQLYQAAADQGYAAAQNNLAWFYENGKGVNQNGKRAFELYELAALQGCPGAQHNLAICYEEGTLVTRDLTRAKALYRAAADQGDLNAREALQRLG